MDDRTNPEDTAHPEPLMSVPSPSRPKRDPRRPSKPAPTKAEVREPVLIQRYGRGRLGGSGALLALIQRARSQGRRVKPLDGDLKSRTLAGYYRSHTPDGVPIEDGVSMPRSEDLADFKAWIAATLDAMANDRISRVLDISGGDRVMQEFLHDMNLLLFCGEIGAKLLSLCMLGPDIEDFNHIRAAVDAEVLHPGHMILLMNEGVIRSGQSPAGAFDIIKHHPDFLSLIDAGAVPVYMSRLPCMDAVREQKLDFYDVAAGRPGPVGQRPKATMQHMTGKWLADGEKEHVLMHTSGRLP